MSKKNVKVSVYGTCKCSLCGQTATSATIGKSHLSCPMQGLPQNFDRSLRGRLVLREGMVVAGTWQSFDPVAEKIETMADTILESQESAAA